MVLVSNLALTLLLSCGVKTNTQRGKLQETKDLFESIVYPPPPVITLSQYKLDSIYSSTISIVDSILNLSPADDFHFQNYVENELSNCLNVHELDKSFNDTLIIVYSKLKSNNILLTKIENKKGRFKDQKVIKPIHYCLYEMKWKSSMSEKILNEYTSKKYRSYVILENGKFKRSQGEN